MFEIRVPYGRGKYLTHAIDESFIFEEIKPAQVEAADNPENEIIRAIDNPIGDSGLGQFKDAKSVAIVISDPTRPVPSKLILKVLLDKLEQLGVGTERISVLVGSGLHPPCSEEEAREIIGEDVFSKVKVVVHDANNESTLTYLGESSGKTPIWINNAYLNAEKRIVTGMIDPHQFMGFSGGGKGLVIGLGGARTIEANHSLMKEEGAELGCIINNPARTDLDEIGARVGIDFVVNVVLNHKKMLHQCIAGDFMAVHRAGVNIAERIVKVKVSQPADVVIASPGGYPKDINVYQAQKGLASAERIVKPGGVIILAAECSQGMGDDLFNDAIVKYHTPEEIVASFAEEKFKMGAHKAFFWARSLTKAKVIMVSDKLSPEIGKKLMVTIVPDLATAWEKAEKLTEIKRVCVMPLASSTVPVTQD
ncbi:MAG: nickel-dependent lactate racemase [Dehalobacterium sp.]